MLTDEDMSLVPASSFDVAGSVGRWVYQLDTPIPGQSRLHRQIVPADGVIHVRINASASEPWRGRAPWQLAKVSASVRLAYIERSLESEVMVRSAIIIPMPDGAAPKTMVQIKNASEERHGSIQPH